VVPAEKQSVNGQWPRRNHQRRPRSEGTRSDLRSCMTRFLPPKVDCRGRELMLPQLMVCRCLISKWRVAAPGSYSISNRSQMNSLPAQWIWPELIPPKVDPSPSSRAEDTDLLAYQCWAGQNC